MYYGNQFYFAKQEALSFPNLLSVASPVPTHFIPNCGGKLRVKFGNCMLKRTSICPF
ncbi:hypothetical protein GGU45_001169 [Niabella hirudinis]